MQPDHRHSELQLCDDHEGSQAMKLSIKNLAEPAVTYPPGAWEQLAYELERQRMWDSAMQAWRKAMGASSGHLRRAHYEERAKACETRRPHDR
jgi:hypothetical protein